MVVVLINLSVPLMYSHAAAVLVESEAVADWMDGTVSSRRGGASGDLSLSVSALSLHTPEGDAEL